MRFRRIRPRGGSLGPLLAVVVWSGLDSTLAAQTTSEVFAANRAVLTEPGVREIAGLIFASQLLPAELQVEQSAPAAIRKILQHRIEQSGEWRIPATSVRRAALFAAPACLPNPIDASSFESVATIRNEDGTCLTVHAIRAEKIAPLRLGVTELVSCLKGRLAKGEGTILDAVLVAELDAVAVTSEQFRIWIEPMCGPGIYATWSSRWPPDIRGMDNWRRLIDASLAAGGGLAEPCSPLSSDALAGLTDPVECLMILGQRANDANLLAHCRGLFRQQGWSRTADLIPEKCAPSGGCVDRPGSRLAAPLRRAMATSWPFVHLLVSDGRIDVPLATLPAPRFEEAREAFNQASPESLQRAATILADSFASSPDLPTAVLLSATLLALDEPTIALPLARLAYRVNPAHPFAGVNMLRAARVLGRRDLTAAMLPEVMSTAALDDWGKAQVAEIKTWVDGRQPSSLPVP